MSDRTRSEAELDHRDSNGTDQRFERGLAIRKEVVGEAHVERSMANVSDFSRPMQEWVTRACWGGMRFVILQLAQKSLAFV